jgi:hypothetical protein
MHTRVFWGARSWRTRQHALQFGLTVHIAPKAAIHRPGFAEEVREMSIQERQLTRSCLSTLLLNFAKIDGSNEA